MPRKRKRRIFGSITTITRTKHVIRWMEDTPKGRMRRSKTIYGTYRQADEALSAIRVSTSPEASPTVGRAHDEWWMPMIERKVAAGKLKARTAGFYDRVWRVHVSPRWSDVPLSKVKRLDVQEWLLGITLGDGKQSIVVLRGIMAEAVRMEAIESNNLAGVQFEFGEKSRERSKAVYSLDEARAMLSKLRGGQCEAPFILACFGGMRTGESLACRCDEVFTINAEGMTFAAVPVLRQMPDAGDEPEESTKTKWSARTALVPDPYASTLLDIVRAKMRDGVEWIADRGDGMPMNKSMLDRAWERDAGENRIPFANLRPSWRTFAQFEWEVPGDTLEVLMGHSLHGVSGRHYIRPDVNDLAASMARAMRRNGHG